MALHNFYGASVKIVKLLCNGPLCIYYGLIPYSRLKTFIECVNIYFLNNGVILEAAIRSIIWTMLRDSQSEVKELQLGNLCAKDVRAKKFHLCRKFDSEKLAPKMV